MLKVSNISRSYDDFAVIKDISFNVNKGEVVGLLGANGAGKSTTLNMIAGYFPPNTGRVTLNDFDSVRDSLSYRGKIGYLPEVPPLYQDMTIAEQLQTVCSVKKIPRKDISGEIDRVSRLCQINDVLRRLNRSMSKGYKQRIGLAQALIGSPDLLILDEPTAGLDPRQIIDFRTLISDLKSEQSLIISSHILSEISAVADRVLVLNNGIIAADSPTANLMRTSSGTVVLEARIHGDTEKVKDLILGLNGIVKLESVESVEAECMDYLITCEENRDIRKALFQVLSTEQLPLMQLKTRTPTLEEFFIQLTSGTTG